MRINTSDFVMAIDTSNYTTSIAVINGDKKVITDKRKALRVKQGERGLRQSHALFQHIENLPAMIENTLLDIDSKNICGIIVSDRPRPIENSYMPVFNAGVSFGRTLAASLSKPMYRFSHQEGHLAAATYGTTFNLSETFLAYHLSGGTCELLHVDKDKVERIGGSKDISFGQVLDRIGVAMGMSFPAGKEMDKLAMRCIDGCSSLKQIPFDGLEINLSGLETQIQRLLESEGIPKEQLIYSLFYEITNCLIKWVEKATEVTKLKKILFTGGVAASDFIRKQLDDYFYNTDITIEFGQAVMSTDNAVGLAMLGGNKLWR